MMNHGKLDFSFVLTSILSAILSLNWIDFTTAKGCSDGSIMENLTYTLVDRKLKIST